MTYSMPENWPPSLGCRLFLLEPVDDEEALPGGEPGDLLSPSVERNPFTLPGVRDPEIAEEPTFGFVSVGEMNVAHPPHYAKTDIGDIGDVVEREDPPEWRVF
jgi:hypothetical protein